MKDENEEEKAIGGGEETRKNTENNTLTTMRSKCEVHKLIIRIEMLGHSSSFT